MTITNIDHHSISVLKKIDSIDYCDFHYHGIAIISIYIAQLYMRLAVNMSCWMQLEPTQVSTRPEA